MSPHLIEVAQFLVVVSGGHEHYRLHYHSSATIIIHSMVLETELKGQRVGAYSTVSVNRGRKWKLMERVVCESCLKACI